MRSLSIWWLELEVTPVTIDGPTVGNIEFSHKSYNPVALFAVLPVGTGFSEALLLSLPGKSLFKYLIELCIVST